MDGDECLVHLLDHFGREAMARFVENQELRTRHQPAPDRYHLLLAARQRPRKLVAPLPQAWKQLKYVFGAGVEVVLLARDERAEPQVFLHRHLGEHLPSLRHMSDAERRHVMRGATHQIMLAESDRA